MKKAFGKRYKEEKEKNLLIKKAETLAAQAFAGGGAITL